MQSPVDRVENASRVREGSPKVRKTAESAKEKDDNFSRVLREKMKEDPNQKQEKQEKQKRKKIKDELLLSDDTERPPAPTELPRAAADADEPDENSSEPDSEQSAPVDSIDLRA